MNWQEIGLLWVFLIPVNLVLINILHAIGLIDGYRGVGRFYYGTWNQITVCSGPLSPIFFIISIIALLKDRFTGEN